MNKLIIIGNLTSDPTVSNGTAGPIAHFTVAVNSRGSRNAEATYFRVSAFGRFSDTCAQYLKKGSKVLISGPVSSSAYTTRDGAPRASLEVIANEVEFLSSRQESGEYDPLRAQPAVLPASAPAPAQATMDNLNPDTYEQVPNDDLPF